MVIGCNHPIIRVANVMYVVGFGGQKPNTLNL